jgi:hypothetical protein
MHDKDSTLPTLEGLVFSTQEPIVRTIKDLVVVAQEPIVKEN